jgi:Uma2 family endonuclease
MVWRFGSTHGRLTNRTHRLSAALAFPPDAIEIDNPVVVVEVLSPSTAAIDHGAKLSGYFSVASVLHYLILDPERRVVIHHKRGGGDAIETRVLTGGVARFDPPGFEVAVEALFPPA